ANQVFKGFGGANDYQRAEAAFNQAISLDPQIAEARMLMVFIYFWRGQKQKARDEVAQMLTAAPNEAVVYFVKAILNRLDGEYEKSLRSLDRLVELDPPVKTVAEYHRALISIFRGKADKAKEEMEKLVATQSDSPIVLTGLALANYYTGDVVMASALIKQVLSHDPNMHGVRPIAAICLAAQGQNDESLEQLTEPVMKNAAADY